MLFPDDFGGVVRNDSLVLHLRIAPEQRCAPGYLLRAELHDGRIGPAALDALAEGDAVCPQRLLHPLHFVPAERDWL